MTVPGGKIMSTPAARSGAMSDAGTTPPTTIMAERQMRRGERRYSHDMNLSPGREGRHLLRRREERSDRDVKAEIGEGRSDDLLAAIMTVLTQLRHQNARRAAFVLGEGADHLRGASVRLGA